MVKKTNIQTTINLPTSFNAQQRELAGRKILLRIKERTRSGLSAKGKAFPGYTKEYKQSLDFKLAGKSNTPNLTQTGDMLAELSVISHSQGKITIGYTLDHPDAGKVEGNTIGTFGQSTPNSSKARDFIGLPQSEIDLIIAEVKQELPEASNGQQSLVDGILSSLGL